MTAEGHLLVAEGNMPVHSAIHDIALYMTDIHGSFSLWEGFLRWNFGTGDYMVVISAGGTYAADYRSVVYSLFFHELPEALQQIFTRIDA